MQARHADRRDGVWPGGHLVKAAPAASLARRQRRAQPWEARLAHAGPHALASPVGWLIRCAGWYCP